MRGANFIQPLRAMTQCDGAGCGGGGESDEPNYVVVYFEK